MRTLVNRYSAWVCDFNTDAFGQVARFTSFIAVLVVVVLGVVFGAVAAITFATGNHPPSLFCPNGSEVRSTPDTEIVGKTAVDGVRYTCS
jgi:hypothetical protein